jgi:hypothetical protein
MVNNCHARPETNDEQLKQLVRLAANHTLLSLKID